METFWIVWREYGGVPVYQHGTEGLAKAEASRLAAQHKGVKFYVLQSVGHAIVTYPVQWVEHDVIPF